MAWRVSAGTESGWVIRSADGEARSVRAINN